MLRNSKAIIKAGVMLISVPDFMIVHTATVEAVNSNLSRSVSE